MIWKKRRWSERKVLETLFIIVILSALIIGSITDLKTREVPDWLNYSLIAIGLGGRLIYSIITQDWTYIISGVVGFLIFLGIALALFYGGQWGGGDSKMIMALGAIIGWEFKPINAWLSTDLPLMANFLINALLMGALLGLIFSVYKAIGNRNKFLITYEKEAKKSLWIRIIAYTAGAILIILGVSADSFQYKLLCFAFSGLIILSAHLMMFIKAVEKSCLIKPVAPEKLTEGDWIVDDIVIKGKRIAGPKDLGIEKKQIKELIKLKQKGIIKYVRIKEGMPFVPAFLLGYVITLIWGNIILMFL